MLIDFPYKGYEQIDSAEIPDQNLIGIFAPASNPGADQDEIIRRAFDQPIGANALREEAAHKSRVLLIIDDATRGTPVEKLLHYVIRELEAAGLKDKQIILLTAQGTHREMTEEELKQKLGSYWGRFSIFQHHWLEESELHLWGYTSDETPVKTNRLLSEVDFVIGFGSIVPHRVKGFSGGAKIVFPGVAGREIQERNQWEAALRKSEQIMGIAENPIRHRIEEAAKLAGLRFIVNIVSDQEKRIIGCFAGDPVLAHRAGCELSRDTNTVKLPRRADIVLIDSHPADRDFWQSAKGFYSGTMAVRDGGTIINVAPNPEGVAENHPIVLEIGYRPYAEVIQMVQTGQIADIVGAAILANIAQIVDKADCILVSPGISWQDTERLGFRYASNVQEALDLAFSKQGRSASVAVLKHGGHILPRIETEPKREHYRHA